MDCGNTKITSMRLYPRRRNVAAQVAEEFKRNPITYATPPMEERREKEKYAIYARFLPRSAVNGNPFLGRRTLTPILAMDCSSCHRVFRPCVVVTWCRTKDYSKVSYSSRALLGTSDKQTTLVGDDRYVRIFAFYSLWSFCRVLWKALLS